MACTANTPSSSKKTHAAFSNACHPKITFEQGIRVLPMNDVGNRSDSVIVCATTSQPLLATKTAMAWWLSTTQANSTHPTPA